jgi:hypothetical protein
MERVLADVAAERARQHRKWHEQNHPDGTGPDTRPLWAAWPLNNLPWNYPAEALADAAKEITGRHAENGDVTWSHILLEEVFEALAEDDAERLRVELIQVAAVAVQWAEALDRRLMDEVHASRSSRHEARAAALEGEGIS